MLDIRPVKVKFREHYKKLRIDMPPAQKSEFDRKITRNIMGLWQYKRCSLLLTYVSTENEVDTIRLIRQALDDKKRVAVPKCIDSNHLMRFYYIDGLEQLTPGCYGILEPDSNKSEQVISFSDSLCLVPALCYDWEGYRLGYGKGYYDRFLASYDGAMVGAVYSSCVRRRLPHGKYDRPVELLVTESYIRKTLRTGR
ncbi:MAG: 5-formyltetrahydrofolate cyclo-ligase [Oscillospiraceae bacterium]|nr:5-formyltetrahydrofolate cyclo-ligase [Oscillospiraceae bacterium]MDD4414438.1 5-formyltetrahydrofolate cyclo-ligase [Oscillospiraceae bacterium]